MQNIPLVQNKPNLHELLAIIHQNKSHQAPLLSLHDPNNPKHRLYWLSPQLLPLKPNELQQARHGQHHPIDGSLLLSTSLHHIYHTITENLSHLI